MAQVIRPLNGIQPAYWDYFPQIVARITTGNLQQLREILDSPWVQEEVQGEKRLMRLMRIGDRRGTILHAAVRTKNIEKITEVLREDRGGRQAFLVYQNDEARFTPLHRAAVICSAGEANIIQLLLANGGDAAKRVRNGNGRYPEEIAARRAIQDLLVRGEGPDVAAEPPLSGDIQANAAPAAELLAQRIAEIAAVNAVLAPPAAVPPAVPVVPAGEAAVPPAPPGQGIAEALIQQIAAQDAAAAVPPAAPAAPAGEAAPAAPAAPAVPVEPPPAVPFVVIRGGMRPVWDYYVRHYHLITDSFFEDRPVQNLVNFLREASLQQQMDGERRIERLMRIVWHHGTILHHAMNMRASREKLLVLLQPWTGARKAFLLKNDRGETPLRVAVRRFTDETYIQTLVDNGGQISVNVLDDNGQRPSQCTRNNRVRNVLTAAEAAIVGQAVPVVQRFIVNREDNPPAPPPIGVGFGAAALREAVRQAELAAMPAAPAAVAPAAEDVPVVHVQAPVPPPVEFIPMARADATREYNMWFSRLQSKITDAQISIDDYVTDLNNPWLQQKVNGVRRIENVMRISAVTGTILHAALNQISIPSLTQAKIREILRPERGGQAAFRVLAQNRSQVTPLHYAAQRVTDVDFMRFLLDNGGRAALKITDSGHRFPLDYIPEDEANRVPIRAIILESMEGAPDPVSIDRFVVLADEEAGPMEINAIAPNGPMYKGYSKEDAGILNSIFEDVIRETGERVPGKSENVLCPVCLEFAQRKDGCMYLREHKCKRENRHERLYQAYKQGAGETIMFCTVCGRICSDHNGGHRHHVLTDGEESVKAGYAIQGAGHTPFGNDCRNGDNRGRPAGEQYSNEGGGGVPEKIRRFHRLLTVACQLQDEIGKKPHKEMKDRLIIETWKGANIYVHDPEGILQRKDLGSPCELLSEAEIRRRLEPPVPEGFPDIASPNPVPTQSEDNKCFINLDDVHEPILRPTFAMPHKVGEEIKDHGGQKICAIDLVSGLQANGNSGSCPFDPPCQGLVHPADLKLVLNSLTQEMVEEIEPGRPLEEYKKRVYESFYESFYSEHPEFRPAAPAAQAAQAAQAAPEPGAGLAAAAAQQGGAEDVPSLFGQMTDGICEMPPKGGRYKTYRKKQKGKTQKRKLQ